MKIDKLIFGLVGLIGKATDAVTEFTDEIAERGELLRSNNYGGIGELVGKALGKPRELRKIASEIIDDALDGMGFATQEDLAAVKERLAEAERNVRELKHPRGDAEEAESE